MAVLRKLQTRAELFLADNAPERLSDISVPRGKHRLHRICGLRNHHHLLYGSRLQLKARRQLYAHCARRSGSSRGSAFADTARTDRRRRKYLDEHREAKAVLAGGMGFDEPMSEAKCMYDTMVEDGISPDRLIMEDKSKNTMENFRYSREVLADNDLGEDITVTTDSFHMLRAMLIVRQQGFKGRVGAVCAETRLEFLPTYVVREWFALPFQLIR
ncbi:MAG: YdcF family protein [Ruminococcus sp.]|nr:YdcF family protein [Ruminococcus sp.]